MGLSSALCLSVMALQAQETNEIEQLKKLIQQQQQQIDTLTRRLDEFTRPQTNPPSPPAKTQEQQ